MQLMRRFAKTGTVLYVNSIVIQKPKLGKNSRLIEKIVRKTKSIMRGLKESSEGFWVYSPPTLPVHHIPWARDLNELLLRQQIIRVSKKLGIRKPLVWVACPGACETALRLEKSRLVYQRTDRWEEFPNLDVATIKNYDRKLKSSADLTVFVSASLYEEERTQCRKAFYLDHGVDYEIFANAHKNRKTPFDMKGIPRPIVGFFGGIDDHTMDIGFVERVVDMLDKFSFVFVGKASVDCSALKAKKNVWLHGQKPYEQIPHYGKCFDVAIMPWKQNRWIEACNPIKLKEYLALGKPIVSTPFSELQKYHDVIHQAQTPAEFCAYIKKAIEEDNPELINARRNKIKDASWDSKAQLVMEELSSKELSRSSIA